MTLPVMEPSPRELEIWRRISLGERRKQMAFEMGIDVGTVDAHKAHLAAKLGIKGENAAMLTRAWFERGMEQKHGNTCELCWRPGFEPAGNDPLETRTGPSVLYASTPQL